MLRAYPGGDFTRRLALLASILCGVLLACHAHAGRPRVPTVQWVFGSSQEEHLANSTRYYPPFGQSVVPVSTQRGSRAQVWIAGTVRQLFCHVAHDFANDLGETGTTATVTLLKNGVATALSATIIGGPGFERDCLPAPDADVVAVAEGDTLEIQFTVVGTTRPNGRVVWAFQFEPAPIPAGMRYP